MTDAGTTHWVSNAQVDIPDARIGTWRRDMQTAPIAMGVDPVTRMAYCPETDRRYPLAILGGFWAVNP